jgi:hypothetical protein
MYFYVFVLNAPDLTIFEALKTTQKFLESALFKKILGQIINSIFPQLSRLIFLSYWHVQNS